MCGIAGLQVAPSQTVDPQILKTLQTAMFHRGPDAQTTLSIGTTSLVIDRLAIVDIKGGTQPITSSDGLTLIANAEIYNAPELRESYPKYPFKTKSDCEPILALYKVHGLDFVHHLRGMYAIALHDSVSDRLIISRDPFGIKPLYFTSASGFFAFASELSALLDAGVAERTISEIARSELLQTKYVIGTKTICPQIFRVAPGDTIIVEKGKIVEIRNYKTWPPYLQPSTSKKPAVRPQSSGAFLRKFGQVIFDSVDVHLRADAPWRLLYSGGIDSTILMLAARDISGGRTYALTVGYERGNSEDESRTALKLARGAKVSCDRIEMTARDFWSLAPRIAACADDPMADPAILPLFMLGKEASRQCAKVVLCGEGADEIFGGYSRYRRATLPAIFRRRPGQRGVFSNTALPDDGFEGWNDALTEAYKVQKRYWKSQLQAHMAVDVLERLPNCLLIKLDRALMANGVEGRTPFLDREVVKFAARLPDYLKANFFRGKQLLRDWLANAYPEADPYARKRGFDVPIGTWMHQRSDELGKLVSAQPGVMQVMDPNSVKGIFNACLEDAQPAWSTLFYALWHAHHIQQIPCDDDIGAVLSESAKLG